MLVSEQGAQQEKVQPGTTQGVLEHDIATPHREEAQVNDQPTSSSSPAQPTRSQFTLPSYYVPAQTAQQAWQFGPIATNHYCRLRDQRYIEQRRTQFFRPFMPMQNVKDEFWVCVGVGACVRVCVCACAWMGFPDEMPYGTPSGIADIPFLVCACVDVSSGLQRKQRNTHTSERANKRT